ncbi:fluoride efflux transporter FluC [Bifidobacterium vespertilionis]|uniref:Fluoride-specific ion channel FluC n=1 Tax=Bifidobacterium vespertilionis TaxID=2562524 RepID=A0A5J5DV53_9BIFI|nr:CrcB family protein [Bifidobacterium vespertilionis]KAA8820788.1 CrcB family protein [Bifidobacterium vespertilionis]KAA8822257.1 CrcB family protein [Bifidobacterium vespertilionis]
MMVFLGICACGGLGAVARFVLTVSIKQWWKHPFPLPTFIINIIATFCAGVAAGAYAQLAVTHPTYLLFVTGFLGGFSTFSTAINEIVTLARKGKTPLAAAYLAATMLVPLLCVTGGWLLAGALL